MKDFLTKKQRSHRMSLIKSKDTKPELFMSKALDFAGIAHERHVPGIFGKPDIILPGRRIAVFVDGKFFHGKHFSEWQHKLKPFWREKIARNIRRDKKVNRVLRKDGWSVLRVWEDDVLKKKEKCLAKIARAMAKTPSPGPCV